MSTGLLVISSMLLLIPYIYITDLYPFTITYN
ncbi:hypothetical protein [Caudoviricetes sp.]|nr:MAG: hypothetical protein [Podoviridae sp. ct2cs2]UOF77551.1 hypothetical protein [Caudoviricetes sp.]